MSICSINYRCRQEVPTRQCEGCKLPEIGFISLAVEVLELLVIHIITKIMFYKKVTEKEILKIRNDIFIQDVVPVLEKKGFVKSPFKTACFGRTSNNNIFIYEMCRLRKDSRLEVTIQQ